MTIVKTIAKAFYNFAFNEQERAAEGKLLLTDSDRLDIAVGYLARDGKTLDRTSKDYRKLYQFAEDLVVMHSGKSSFNQMARSHVRTNSGENYYIISAIGRVLEGYSPFNKAAVKGGETNALLELIETEFDNALTERNPVKRRAAIRRVVKANVPEIEGVQLDFVVEALQLLRK